MATGGAQHRPSTWVLGLDATSTTTVAACRMSDQSAMVLAPDANGGRTVVSGGGLGVVYRDAVGQVGAPPKAVRLACPATWSQARRQRLLDDAAAAGLPSPVVVLAPVVAALAYSERHAVTDGSYLLVGQLIGERLEATILQAMSSGFEPIGCPTSGSIDIKTSADDAAPAEDLMSKISEMEDIEGLTPEWISVVLLAGSGNRTSAVRRLLADSHPGVPIFEGDDVAAAVSIGATHAFAEPRGREPPPDAGNDADLAPLPLGAAFQALNADWELDAELSPPRSGPFRRRQLVMLGAAVLALVVVSSVLSDRTAPSGQPRRAAAVASPASTSPTSDPRPVVGSEVLPDGYPPAQPVAMVAFDAVLTHLDVKPEWDQNIAGSNTDLGDVCGRPAPNLAVMSIRRKFISSTGSEKLASVVNTFSNPVTAQASLMEVERNFAACNRYERFDNGRWVRMEVMRSQPTPPRHGDSSFVVALGTAEEAARLRTVTWYGLVRHDRYVTEIEYSVTVEDQGTLGAEAASIAERDRFERLLRRASHRLEHVIG